MLCSRHYRQAPATASTLAAPHSRHPEQAARLRPRSFEGENGDDDVTATDNHRVCTRTDDGEALWFNGGLGILKVTAEQTEGQFTAYELRIPKGFAAPLHSHKNEDEFFIVLSGEVRLRHGDEVVEAVPGSFAFTPRGHPSFVPRRLR